MKFIVVSNSEIRCRAMYAFVKEVLKFSDGDYLVGDYDMDYLLFEGLDYLFFDRAYYENYKSKFVKGGLRVGKLYLIALEEEGDSPLKNLEGIELITGDSRLGDLIQEGRQLSFEDMGLPISPTDKNILFLLSKGLTNKEVGARLYLSEKTIKNKLTRIYKDLGVKGKYEAMALYLDKEYKED